MAARKSTTTKSTTTATVEKAVAASSEEQVVEKNTTPLKDTDEIEVVSLIPNVSYKDNKTGDFYEWDDIGHVELMTVETLKGLWRSYKTYFREMWLKPNDERVIKQFGLTKVFENYEYLMKESSYTRANISDICKKIETMPNGIKYTICNLVKSEVAAGGISDVSVIKALEKHLNMDLLSSLD